MHASESVIKLCVPNVIIVPNDGISGSHKS